MAKEPVSFNRNNKAGVSKTPGLAWRANRGPAIEIHWSDVDGQLLQRAIDTVSRDGGAIILGRTRDGGALSVVILTDNEKIKEYPSSVAAAEALLTELSEFFTG